MRKRDTAGCTPVHLRHQSPCFSGDVWCEPGERFLVSEMKALFTWSLEGSRLQPEGRDAWCQILIQSTTVNNSFFVFFSLASFKYIRATGLHLKKNHLLKLWQTFFKWMIKERKKIQTRGLTSFLYLNCTLESFRFQNFVIKMLVICKRHKTTV